MVWKKGKMMSNDKGSPTAAQSALDESDIPIGINVASQICMFFRVDGDLLDRKTTFARRVEKMNSTLN
jgi:hypothetical protein